MNVEELTNEQTYQSVWNAIAMISCKEVGNTKHVRGLRPLWIDRQNTLNGTCCELFIEGFQIYMHVTIDDDRIHYQIERTDLQGLKLTQHVRDNKKGFVAHTVCYNASGLLLGVEWEWSNDDSTTAATERLIRSQLSPASGQNGDPMLVNTEFAMDRGYCLPLLIFNFIIPSGAEILGTIKCCPMFPYKYDQMLATGDTRQVIHPKGFKAHFLKKLTLKNKQITGVAYRDGKGGFTLGLTANGR